MKKRLLITSIVMMLVVAVALSTATYAWFTSNDSVTASTINLTAAVSDDAALGIGWTGSTAGTSITTTASGTLLPMAPADLVVGTTLDTVDFNSAKIKTVSDVLKFKSVDSADAQVFDNGLTDSAKVETFYVKNLSGTNKISQITITPTIEVADNNANDGTNLVRIAVFKKDGSDYKLVGVMASEAGVNAVKGTPVADKNSTPVAEATDDSPMTNYTATKTSLTLGGLDVTAQHDLKILLWMDGQLLDDSKQGYGAKVSFEFTAGTAGSGVTVLPASNN